MENTEAGSGAGGPRLYLGFPVVGLCALGTFSFSTPHSQLLQSGCCKDELDDVCGMCSGQHSIIAVGLNMTIKVTWSLQNDS